MRARFTKPYVDALFAVAGGTAAVEALVPRLEGFAKALRSSDELRAVLKNPGIERERKNALVTAIVRRDALDGLGMRFLLTLLANRRIGSLEEVLGAVRERIDREKNVVEADVKAAAPLDAASAAAIQTALEAKTRKNVRVRHEVDPSLLGGFVVRIGSEVYDASLAQRLRRARLAFHTASQES